ncbi:hypothetical protein CAP35_08025 [Chitinophagaceae bacterium IBVUCB1]|nr:hypothetical protein CAP35_08025 [Chitinophagaceae bacterium IBVUCB1]
MASLKTKPWNRTAEAVYSLVTSSNGRYNMNICTYVTAISMQPKMYAIAVYHNTHTHNNMMQEDVFVLQLLHESQYKLVNYLGKHSGSTTDKLKYLQSKNLIAQWQGIPVLKEAAAYLLLEKQAIITTGGDHDLLIASVKAYANNKAGAPLTLEHLRKNGIIRSGK